MDRNQQQAGPSSERYSEKYFLSFPDGSLTRKFLKFSDYVDKKKWTEEMLSMLISEKIYQFNHRNKLLYYIGSMKPMDFNAYVKSKAGEEELNLIKAELAHCFTQLQAWARTQNLEILDTNHQSSTVDEALNQFHNRLLNGELSDRSVLFYADGKKAIETIAVFVQDETIDLDFRRNQLIALSADGNLMHCADGCYSRFMATADSLRTYADFNLPSVIKKFIVNQAQEQARKSPDIESSTYISLLCFFFKISVLGNEIHAKNYLANRLLTEIGLESLVIQDELSKMFYRAPNLIYERYALDFKRKIRASHLIQFLQAQYYQKQAIHFTDEGISKQIDIKELENFLLSVGIESGFNLHEVLEVNTEGGAVIKDKAALSITLSERLLANGWFALGENSRWHDIYRYMYSPYINRLIPAPMSQESADFRIFSGNLALSWLKLEGERKTILHIIAQQNNPIIIFEKSIPANQLGALLENSEDVLLFFSVLPGIQHKQALDWLHKSQFDFRSPMSNKLIFFEKALQMNGQITFEKNHLLLNFTRLFRILSKQALPGFLKRFELILIIEEILIHFLDSSNVVKQFQLTYLTDFIRFILIGGFNEFKGLHFYGNDLYLENIDFSDILMQEIFFETPLKNINFHGVYFNNIVFSKAVESMHLTSGHGGINFHSCCIDSSFYNLFGDISFFSYESNFVKNIVFNHIYGNIRFYQNMNIENVRFYKGNLGTLYIHGNIYDSVFSEIQFKKIKINGNIKNTFFTNIDFRNTQFISLHYKDVKSKNVFTGKFYFIDTYQDNHKDFFYNSKFSTQSLIDFLSYPTLHDPPLFPILFHLRGTDLREVDFNNVELQHFFKQFSMLDLSRVNLEKTNLGNFITKLRGAGYPLKLVEANLRFANLENTNLAYIDLTGADLRDCDLSTTSLRFAVLKQTQIDRIQLQADQLFIFYDQDHRDFLSVQLVGNLDSHLHQHSLSNAKLSLQVFKHLIEQGFRNFQQTYLTAIPEELIKHYQQQLGFNFENVRLKKEGSLDHCLETHLRRKREQSCLFDWQDIDEFNEEQNERRNLNKLRIDSERFLETVYNMPEVKRTQLIDFISHHPIAGSKKNEVLKLTGFQTWQFYLNKAHHAANFLNSGLMIKSTLIDFLYEDYEDTAINLGLMSSGPVLSHFAETILSKGEALQLSGKQLLGNAYKMAAPFLRRATSAYIVYDLAQAIDELDPDNAISVLRVVDDSIFIGVDVAEIGIETAEVFELFEGVSSILGPIGEVVGTVVFLGTDIYQAVNRVQEITIIIPLTATEKFYEGIRAFFGMSIESHLQLLIEEKQINNNLVNQAVNYLKQYPFIQYYIFPIVNRLKKCTFKPNTSVDPYDAKQTFYKKRCEPVFYGALNNQIILDKTRLIKWSRAKPDLPAEAKLLCFRSDEKGELNINSYLCENAMGITSFSNHASHNYTLINVGEGIDEVQGFLDSPNIVVTSKGFKILHGGHKDDVFILQNDEIIATINGREGIDTLDLLEFEPEASLVGIDLHHHTIDMKRELFIHSIEQILGRPAKQDKIICACDTIYIDARDGKSNAKKDEIIIPSSLCDYQITFKVSAYTLVRNLALRGNFIYLVSHNHHELEFYLERAGTHQLFFDCQLSELTRVLFNSESSESIQQAIFYFKLIDKKSSDKTDFTIVQWSNEAVLTLYLKNQTEIKLGKNRIYILQKSRQPLNKIIQDYPAISERLQAVLVIESHNQKIVIGSSRQEVLQNDPYYPSHLVGNGKENIYQIIAREESFYPQDVTLYQLQAPISAMDSLDLRQIVKILGNRTGCPISFTVYNLGEDLCLYIEPIISCNAKTQVLPFKIILKAAITTGWYEQLNIIGYHSFLEIKLLANKTLNPLWGLKPKPLIWDESKRIMFIHAHDVEPDTSILMPENVNFLDAARIGKQLIDLILITSPNEPFYGLVFKDYYAKIGSDQQKLSSLLIHYNQQRTRVEEIVKQSIHLASTLDEIKNQEYKEIIQGNLSDQVGSLLPQFLKPISLNELQDSYQKNIYQSIKLPIKIKRSVSSSVASAIPGTSLDSLTLEYRPVQAENFQKKKQSNSSSSWMTVVYGTVAAAVSTSLMSLGYFILGYFRRDRQPAGIATAAVMVPLMQFSQFQQEAEAVVPIAKYCSNQIKQDRIHIAPYFKESTEGSFFKPTHHKQVLRLKTTTHPTITSSFQYEADHYGNTSLIKLIGYLFGKRSAVKRMNKAEKILTYSKRGDPDNLTEDLYWAKRHLDGGLTLFGKK